VIRDFSTAVIADKESASFYAVQHTNDTEVIQEVKVFCHVSQSVFFSITIYRHLASHFAKRNPQIRFVVHF
jgi:hypothetical protein